MEYAYTFDDVTLVPQYNNIPSRTIPSLESWLTTKTKVKMPIVPANMDTVIGDELADICSDFDGASWSEAKLNVIGANTEVAIKKNSSKAQKQDPALKNSDLEYKVARLINRYRRYGHYSANLDPLKLKKPEVKEVLTKDFHQIGRAHV